ncbi:endoglucanase 10 isoform X2 [Andrographis paniculata]|uniref:endoglucanase 10 isoform X2 n=1 Tax=Andrographis paniculata TaxID=175694 RepID=UPI0021E77368|nr:endoglucanase 10 isoform X2 [Andrographis paniculata]
MEEKGRSSGWCGWFLVLIVLAAIGLGIFYAVKQKQHKSGGGAAPVPGPPGAVDKKYADALKIAMQFFDIQKSGKLENNRIPWRGDSATKDGNAAQLDLSKGMYDAGDHMKFGFPMAFTATVLSWTILEYGDQMKVVNQLEPAQDNLKWITDYLVKAHPSDNVLYIQVGSPEVDHACWDRPEDMSEGRPLTQVNSSAPGSDVAGETAAALASASLVFRTSDSAYSDSLLKHAKQLFKFADAYRNSYSVTVPEVQNFYNSTGFGDELLWAASWLYHATGDKAYFEYVTGKNGDDFANWGSPTWFSWDNKLAGAQVLLSRVSFFGAKPISTSNVLRKYRSSAEAVMCGLLPKSPTATTSRTDNGLIYISEWNSLQHPVASAFLAAIYSDYMLTSRTATISCDGRNFRPSDLRKFATSQTMFWAIIL